MIKTGYILGETNTAMEAKYSKLKLKDAILLKCQFLWFQFGVWLLQNFVIM